MINYLHNPVYITVYSRPYDASLAIRIAQECVANPDMAKLLEWNLKNALLYGFGILTTLGKQITTTIYKQFCLGYGKIETRTAEGRVFTVVWGIIGVPITVIILTNFGLYLRKLERTLRHYCVRRYNERCDREKSPVSQKLKGEEITQDVTEINPISLMFVVVVYLTFGAIVMPLLNGKFEFVNGLYYSYICFTAIEFGALVPEK